LGGSLPIPREDGLRFVDWTAAPIIWFRGVAAIEAAQPWFLVEVGWLTAPPRVCAFTLRRDRQAHAIPHPSEVDPSGSRPNE
jgi:hypothetical protein